MTFVWTDDPNDPCAYDVQWTEDEDDGFDNSTPYMPSGPVSRVYRGIHARCAQAVAEMHAEHTPENGFPR